jgi:hypothetical protein
MKSLKSSWKVWVGVVIGFALGVLIFHTPTVKAQTGINVNVELVPFLGISSTLRSKGTQIVGFSCTSKDGEPECYVASVR